MKYLFINSMSRTGASLLHQLLYGHPQVYLSPYRTHFVCKKPFGFPLVEQSIQDKEQFFYNLMAKTTVVTDSNNWPDYATHTLAEFFPEKMSPSRLVMRQTPLETAIWTIHDILEVDIPKVSYYCLYDDHSYMLGHDAFCKLQEAKILTTIRDPLDMIASKKNMLTLHVYGQQDPQNLTLKKEVLAKELLRAVFAWWAASYEYANKQALPVHFKFLKSDLYRESIMKFVAAYLEIDYTEVLLDERTPLGDGKYFNEMLGNGSSINTIAYLTKGQKSNNLHAKALSLNAEEQDYLLSLIHYDSFTEIVSSQEFFYENFGKFHESMTGIEYADYFSNWTQLYKNCYFEQLFLEYSSFNYGFKNAKEAFKTC